MLTHGYTCGMKSITAYLATLPPDQRDAFAQRCGTTVGYLRKAVSAGQRIGESLAIAIERESCRAVTVEEIRPDVDWAYIRATNCEQKQPPALDGQAAGAITVQRV